MVSRSRSRTSTTWSRARRAGLLGALLVVCGVFLAGPAASPAAAGFVEQVAFFDSQIQIQDDGSIHVLEVIDYDFGVLSRHGIFRTLVTAQWFDETYNREYPLTVLSVTGSEGAIPYKIEDGGAGRTRLRIGDPDRYVEGVKRYAIEYRLGAAVNAFDDHDELYWNVTGLEWEVPIERVRVRVSAPDGAIQGAECYSGPRGSQQPCTVATVVDGGARARYEMGAMPWGSGVTIVTMLEEGAISPAPPVLEARWTLGRAFSRTPVTVALSGLMAAAAAIGTFGLAWRRGRDRQFIGSDVDQVMGSDIEGDRSVPLGKADLSAPVEYAPPDGILPGLAGTLIDEKADTLDVTATIVDLAVRGYLRIEEAGETGVVFKKQDWRLVRLAKGDPDPGPDDGAEAEADPEGETTSKSTTREKGKLRPYERKLRDSLFATGDEVLLSDLSQTFAERLAKVKAALYDEVMKKGWFSRSPESVRTGWLAGGIGLFVLGVGITVLLAWFTTLGLLGLPIVLAGILLIFLHGRMPARTAAGTAMVRRVRGFREVIRQAETHMAQWAEKEQIFTRYLPYAVVFGYTDRWAKAFEDLGVEIDTSSWYASSHAFNAAAFGSAMSGFSSSTASTLSSTPGGSGSSGGGGGGFSGGGGGGGGGGSW